MKIGYLNIGFWKYRNPKLKKFIFWEWLPAFCGCKILTIFNVCFTWYGSVECRDYEDEDYYNEDTEDL